MCLATCKGGGGTLRGDVEYITKFQKINYFDTTVQSYAIYIYIYIYYALDILPVFGAWAE